MWHEKKVKIKEDRVVVKLYDKSEKFIKSVVIPTEYYPLPNGEIKCFSALNTTEFIDEKMIKLINSVKEKVGRCYDNTSNLYKKLSPYYDVKMYAGWLFLENDTPVWHSWIVYNDKHIIDLTNKNNKYNVLEYSKKYSSSAKSYEEFIVNYYKKIFSAKNSEKILLGNASESFFYVGVECEAHKSEDFYSVLLDQFPNHETYSNCDKKTRLNRTQQILKNNGMY